MAYALSLAALRLRARGSCIHRALASCLLLAVCTSSMAHACEPAGLDWQGLYQDNDRNRNGVFEPTEWQSLIRLENQPVAWEDEATSRDPHRWRVFKELDSNHDGRLSEGEVSGIYRYFSNPCAGWPWSH